MVLERSHRVVLLLALALWSVVIISEARTSDNEPVVMPTGTILTGQSDAQRSLGPRALSASADGQASSEANAVSVPLDMVVRGGELAPGDAPLVATERFEASAPLSVQAPVLLGGAGMRAGGVAANAALAGLGAIVSPGQVDIEISPLSTPTPTPAPDPVLSDPTLSDPTLSNPATVPDPALPDPALPDPALPDPALPDPALPDPALPDPALLPTGEEAPLVVEGDPATGEFDPDLIPVEVLGVQVVNPEAAAQVNFALAPSNLRAQSSDAELGQPLAGCPGLVVGGRPMDVVLVIDNSGSMDRNDANDLRLRASSSFVKLLSDEIAEAGANNRAAVVQFPRDDFDKSSVTLWPQATVNEPAGLTSDLGRLSVVLPNVPPSEGGTDLGSGMKAALDELRVPPAGSGIEPDLCKARVLILLSDGEGVYDHSLTQRAIEGGVELFVVALGADNALLQAIAPDADHYFVIREGEQLQGLSLGVAEIGPVTNVSPQQLPNVTLAAPDAFPAPLPTPDPESLSRENPDPDTIRPEPLDLSTADVARPMARWFLSDDEGPILLEGYKSRYRTFVDMPPGWVSVGSPQLAFDYTASELARDDSSILLSVDGRPALTQTLGANSGVRQTVSTEVDNDGSEILLEAFAPLVVDDECIDPAHIGRWVELSADTALFSPIEMREVTVADFVAGSSLLSTLTERPLLFVVPPDAHPATLDSLGSVASALMRRAERPQIEVVVGELPQLITGPAVVVNNPNPDMEQAEIEVQRRSGWPVLVLSGSAGAMASAARSLNDSSLDALFDVVRARIDAIAEPAPPLPEDLFTLESEGYDDRTMRGSGEQSISYSFELPMAWQPAEMRVRMVGSYAASLTAVKTDVTVTVNGQPVGSVELRDETGRLDATIAIPPSSLRRGKNFLRFTAHLGSIPVVCTGTSGTDRWVSIHKSTTVGIEYEVARGALDLADVPYHLADPSDAAATDIVLPRGAGALEVQSALEILTAMSDGGERGAPRITTPDNVNSARHLIVIGAGPDQPLLTELADVLSLDPARGLPRSVPEVDGTDAFGAIEIAWSPWGENRLLLVASGETPFGARLAATHLTDPILRSDLTGQLSLVNVDQSDALQRRDPEVLGVTQTNPGPSGEEYQAWLKEQVAAPFDPATGTVDTSTRRIIAFAIAAGLGGMGIIGFIRKRAVMATAGAGGGHGAEEHGGGGSSDGDGDGDGDSADGESAGDGDDAASDESDSE